MAEKDIAEKILEAHNDVFADIVNALLFDGKDVIEPDELFDKSGNGAYKADGRVRGLERDVIKQWKRRDVCIVCLGLENQTDIDSDIPIRTMGYDGVQYRMQLNDRSQKRRYPVVTLVLYFGYKKRWDKPKTLLECLDVPEELKPYVSDYKINLFEIAYLDEETISKFKSDFRVVADYFVQMRTNGDYKPSPQTIKHVNETLQLLSVLTKDNRFEEAYNETEKGEPTNMCEVLDRVETRGKNEGKTDILELMQKLFAQNRFEDAKRATEDSAYCDELLREFGIDG